MAPPAPSANIRPKTMPRRSGSASKASRVSIGEVAAIRRLGKKNNTADNNETAARMLPGSPRIAGAVQRSSNGTNKTLPAESASRMATRPRTRSSGASASRLPIQCPADIPASTVAMIAVQV